MKQSKLTLNGKRISPWSKKISPGGKRIAAVLLAIVMIIWLLPATAGAAVTAPGGDITASKLGETAVTVFGGSTACTWDNSNSILTLKQDITIAAGKSIKLADLATFTIDLAGYTISGSPDANGLINITDIAQLKIKDSSAGKAGRITSSTGHTVNVYKDSASGTFDLDSGIIENTGTNGNALQASGDSIVTLNGGTISTTAAYSEAAPTDYSALYYTDNAVVTLRDTNISAASCYGIYNGEITTTSLTIEKPADSDDSTVTGGYSAIKAKGITIVNNTQVVAGSVIYSSEATELWMGSSATIRRVYDLTFPSTVTNGEVIATWAGDWKPIESPVKVTKNTEIRFAFLPDNGYRFVSAQYTPEGDTAAEIKQSDLTNDAYTLTMPAANVTVSEVLFAPLTVTWAGNDVMASYDSDGTVGDITSGVTPVPMGAEVTLTIAAANSANVAFTPGSGSGSDVTGSYYQYQLPGEDNLTKVPITSRDFSFTMPLSDVTLHLVYSGKTVTWAGNEVTASYNDNGTAVPIISGVTFVPEGAQVTLAIAETNSVGGTFIPGSGIGSGDNVSGSYYQFQPPSSVNPIKEPIFSRNYSFTMPASAVTVMPIFAAVDVAFSELTANGSDSASTTVLTLTFDQDVSNLLVDDITVTGATKGTLTKESGIGVYTLTISDITVADNASANVAVSKEGFNFTPANKDVAVRKYTPPVIIDVAFNELTANGSDSASTTVLTLTFDQDVAGLSADDITVTGATKGTLTKESGIGVYTLTISDITVADNASVNVAVNKAGFNFTPANKDVAVRSYTPSVDELITDLRSQLTAIINTVQQQIMTGNINIPVINSMIEKAVNSLWKMLAFF